MAKEYITNGAIMQCVGGGPAPARIIVPFSLSKVQGRPIGTSMHILPLLNIPSFKWCPKLFSTCSPPMLKWINTCPDVIVNGFEALTIKSECLCGAGGTIKFLTSGQTGSSSAAQSALDKALSELQKALPGLDTDIIELGIAYGINFLDRLAQKQLDNAQKDLDKAQGAKDKMQHAKDTVQDAKDKVQDAKDCVQEMKDSIQDAKDDYFESDKESPSEPSFPTSKDNLLKWGFDKVKKKADQKSQRVIDNVAQKPLNKVQKKIDKVQRDIDKTQKALDKVQEAKDYAQEAKDYMQDLKDSVFDSANGGGGGGASSGGAGKALKKK